MSFHPRKKRAANTRSWHLSWSSGRRAAAGNWQVLSTKVVRETAANLQLLGVKGVHEARSHGSWREAATFKSKIVREVHSRSSEGKIVSGYMLSRSSNSEIATFKRANIVWKAGSRNMEKQHASYTSGSAAHKSQLVSMRCTRTSAVEASSLLARPSCAQIRTREFSRGGVKDLAREVAEHHALRHAQLRAQHQAIASRAREIDRQGCEA